MISIRDILEREIQQKNKNSVLIRNCISQGIPIDDDIVIPLVEQELRRSEAALNGWIMEGYPSSDAQIQSLRNLR